MKPRPRLMWAVTRDGEIHMPHWTGGAQMWLWRTKRQAAEMSEAFATGSKHKWSTRPVRVTPVTPRKRRR